MIVKEACGLNGDWAPSASLEILQQRAVLLQNIRGFFARRNVLEVTTPLISSRANPDPALESIRAGNGPAFIEAKTFRFQGHSIADPVKYRDRSETEMWEARDPLKTFPRDLLDQDLFTEAELEEIRSNVDAEVAAAVTFAEDSPFPPDEELFTDIYA